MLFQEANLNHRRSHQCAWLIEFQVYYFSVVKKAFLLCHILHIFSLVCRERGEARWKCQSWEANTFVSAKLNGCVAAAALRMCKYIQYGGSQRYVFIKLLYSSFITFYLSLSLSLSLLSLSLSLSNHDILHCSDGCHHVAIHSDQFFWHSSLCGHKCINEGKLW